jgi:hypothetical protein
LALYRPTYIKRGVAMKAIRMRGQCMAKHLDWYIDPKHMTEDQRLYLKAPEKLTHFGGTTLRNKINGVKKVSRKTKRPKPTQTKRIIQPVTAKSNPKRVPLAPGMRRRKKIQAIMAILQRNEQRRK